MSESLLGPLSIRPGCRVYALHYPVPEDDEHKDVKVRLADFMITAHPPRLWPYLGRFAVRLQNRPGALAELYERLERAGTRMNILTQEVARTGHRYATCSFVASFAEDHYDPRFDIEKGGEVDRTVLFDLGRLRTEVRRTVERVKKLIHSTCEDLIFVDKAYPDQKSVIPSVRGNEIEALHYFCRRVLKDRKEGKNRDATQPVVGTCVGRRLVFDTRQFESSLRVWGLTEQVPTRCFASMDVEEQNIRVAVLPPRVLASFAKLLIKYERVQSRDRDAKTSRGFILAFAQALRRDFQLWLVRNQTKRYDPSFHEYE